ncbi:PTS sugar transporter subunit IIB [Serratia fonticola]|uniref:PTS sugar transporter subunit IIB n=1 Tax=Serratia TaxID=613 RepID=UPI000FBC8B74|nr:PTS sugar transporter subunit IIB [Serratia fonticola]MBC3382191.1 PTS sugar transporter subunit IIB [Serratia fonticola]MEB7886918.1 PTS sugar transporter subunit IIB [Serratia fonticola]NYA41390.1 PTS sugar transporter subunit IIB [Serratia fonticola]CAI0813996.1 Oligo-beta-mannoside-specific phosphotransferase enzyme IIB component [Serratia fonticola]CAI0817306.1 Oligo-beta-mannoside-specific phosphotransferase enzyme IIB component [Serratia fonticola]
MKKILLVCDLGMSTSLLVKKMQEAAIARGIDAEICAKSIREYKTAVTEFDVALLGPQIRYKLAECEKIAHEHHKKVACIDMMAYGTMKGDKVLDQALALIEEA